MVQNTQQINQIQQLSHSQRLVKSKKFLISMIAFAIALVILIIIFAAFRGAEYQDIGSKFLISAVIVFIVGAWLLSGAVGEAFYDTWKNRHSILLMIIGASLMGAVTFPIFSGETWALALMPIPLVIIIVGLCNYRKFGRF